MLVSLLFISLYFYLKNSLNCFYIYNFNSFSCIYFILFYFFTTCFPADPSYHKRLFLKGLPGCPVARYGYLDSDAGTIPHLAAAFSDTHTGDTTEAVPADEDNDYSVEILKEAGLKNRFR